MGKQLGLHIAGGRGGKVNRSNAIMVLREASSDVARSIYYIRSEWALEGNTLHFAVRENCEQGGSYHRRLSTTLTAYQAKAARKLVAEFV